ncbi:non-functional NADPH-dependent codeinone reductase 2-like [Magnolia sinica]|uniref:non-functional NADPH-dependent codeinone reductase 2-like n=1 Tax=Magnolia sinica TaxID=86752 RepID=UPI00265891AB|nr:non-functional NADPH-dependent codeinone reductase 2-like [Magnolia sinica]
MESIPVKTLSSGHIHMPIIGMGTAAYPIVTSEDTKWAILRAIEIGYRHFDTSPAYISEHPLGEAIGEALRLGLIKSRHELFITSKLWFTDAHRHLVIPALRKTLTNLQLDYLDLYIIHWPISSNETGYTWSPNKDHLQPLDFKAVWEAMEECQTLGLTRSIGVSNFSGKNLAELLRTAKIIPAVNQVEMHPLWQQKNLREFCATKGIDVVAYSPLGASGTLWGTNQVMECKVLKEIAKARGKTIAQVSLRWVYEQGVSFVVKSYNEERMKENLLIFDWALTEIESQQISQITQRRGFTAVELVSNSGPYKSIEELWDGEI